MDTTPTRPEDAAETAQWEAEKAQPVAGHSCPNPEFHGNPYRYCSCGWQEKGPAAIPPDPPTFTMQPVPGQPGVIRPELNGPIDPVFGEEPDVKAMLAEMRALEAANGQAEKALAAEGVQLDLVSLIRVRLEELTEYVLGPIECDEQLNWQRIEFELRLQQRFARELANVAGQVARAKLTAPMPAGSPLIVPGR